MESNTPSPPTIFLSTQHEISTTRMELNGKEVKVVVKEVLKNTAACEACRARKRKCDGQAPCTYCVSKNQECIFSTPKKRGPSLKKMRTQETSPEDMGSAHMESSMLDALEGMTLTENYGNFAKIILPISNHDIMHPRTLPHKVQSYIALSYIARISGSKAQAIKYINQARILGGSIYDRPEIDTVAAMISFAMYYNLVSDYPMSRFYACIGHGLAQLVPSKYIRGKLGVIINNMKLCADPILSRNKELLGSAMQRNAVELHDIRIMDDLICQLFINLCTELLSVLKFNVLGMEPEVLQRKFNCFDNIAVSEEGRLRVLKCLNDMHELVDMTNNVPGGHQFKLLHDVESPMYHLIVELKSGHITDAVSVAYTLLRGLQQLQVNSTLGMINKLSTIFVLGSACKSLHQHGHTNIALKIFEFVTGASKQMDAEFGFALAEAEFSAEGGPLSAPLFSLPSSLPSSLSSSLPSYNTTKQSFTAQIEEIQDTPTTNPQFPHFLNDSPTANPQSSPLFILSENTLLFDPPYNTTNSEFCPLSATIFSNTPNNNDNIEQYSTTYSPTSNSSDSSHSVSPSPPLPSPSSPPLPSLSSPPQYTNFAQNSPPTDIFASPSPSKPTHSHIPSSPFALGNSSNISFDIVDSNDLENLLEQLAKD